MTFESFNNCDVITVGIVLCVLMALIIIMLTKVLCQDKRIESRKEKKEEIDTIGYTLETKGITLTKGSSFEELVKKQKDITAYPKIFLVNAEIPARSRKPVSIRKKYHERIMKITQVIGNNETTIFSYIDNVLKDHFDNYQDEIQNYTIKRMKEFSNYKKIRV